MDWALMRLNTWLMEQTLVPTALATTVLTITVLAAAVRATTVQVLTTTVQVLATPALVHLALATPALVHLALDLVLKVKVKNQKVATKMEKLVLQNLPSLRHFP